MKIDVTDIIKQMPLLSKEPTITKLYSIRKPLSKILINHDKRE